MHGEYVIERLKCRAASQGSIMGERYVGIVARNLSLSQLDAGMNPAKFFHFTPHATFLDLSKARLNVGAPA
jgi:hypothetical protein